MKKIFKIAFFSIALLILANFSSQQSTECPKDYHSKVINGKVELIDGTTYKIDNISISGKYEDLDLYHKPVKKNMNPINSKTKVNLIDIKIIEAILNPDNKPIIQTYNNRDFIEIDVTWKDSGKREPFLIERSMRLFGNDANNKKARKDESFEVIKKLEITGYVERDQKNNNLEKNDKNNI